MANPKTIRQTEAVAVPGMLPPGAHEWAGGAVVDAEPTPLTETALQAMVSTAEVAAPTLEPPAAGQVAATATVWTTANVNALWCINQNRNSWAGFAGVGWRKLSDASDSAIVALTALASHAKQMQCRVDRREEADGKVHELYVW
jgi:hypothetical protein